VPRHNWHGAANATAEAIRRNFLLGALLLAGVAASLPAQELTLDKCLQLAMARNPALAGATARTRESKADFEAARAPLRLTMSANALGTQLNEDRLSPLGASLPPGTSMYTREGFAGLTARQLLYDGGRSKSARDVAARGVDAQREGLAAVRDETIMRVTETFYRALATAELVRVALDAVNRDQAFEAMAAELFRAGKVTRLDALKAASAHVEAERALTTARETAALAIVQLAQTMGLDGHAGLVPRGALPTDLAEPPLGDDAIAATMAQSPDLRRSAYVLEQSRTSLQLARGGNSPAIALQGGYGFRARDVGGGRPEWLVGFTVNWSLVDGGALSAQVSKAQARVAQAEEARRELELDISAQVYGALAAWRIALSDARAAARLVETGREALSAADALYRSGKATALDVLIAQSDLARAEGAQVTAATAYALARAQLARLTGAASAGTT
jgi:outer membrane protein